MESVKADPILGGIGYSDWHNHSNNFVFYDSENPIINYMGLANYTIQEDDTILKQITTDKEEIKQIKDLLDKIGQGEDDGDGGLSFADNYSRIIGSRDNPKGYIIAVDYLTEDNDDDYITFEKLRISDKYSIEEKKKMFLDYLEQNKFKKLEDIDGIKFNEQLLKDNPWIIEVVEEKYKKKIKNGIIEF